MIRIQYLLILLIFFGCKSVTDTEKQIISKFQDTDKFKNTIIESQIYKINANVDNTITTNKGNLLIIPSGSIIDKNGRTVEDSIQIEFAECTELDETILSNLTIQDSASIYESYLSFYFNASRKGNQLQINPDNPIYLELPADKKLSLYKGIRDRFGNMTWKKEKSSVDYLISVPLELLNFYPDGFEREVENGLPFRNHDTLTKNLLDSLYYSFAAELDKSGYYNWGSRFCMINLTLPLLNLLAQEDSLLDELETDSTSLSICGINPASIKAIRDKKFQNTLISTREFETRLRHIFATCDNEILELYVNNLNKNLWEIDELVANHLGTNDSQYSVFKDFASYKQTTVKLSDKKAELLTKHYRENKEKIENDLQKVKNDLIKKRQKLEEIAQEKREEYRDLLKARHEYRMEKFGFEITNFGWYNAAHKMTLREVEKFDLNIKIGNGNQYDRVYSYVVNPKIKSIFSYLSDDKVNFDIVYSDDPDLLLWKNQKFTIIGVGYLDNSIGYKIGEYIQKPIVDAVFNIESNDIQTFRKDLKEFTKGYKRENKILIDLEYQAFFYKEQKRKEKELEEKVFRNNLRKKVFPCCPWFESDLDDTKEILF